MCNEPEVCQHTISCPSDFGCSIICSAFESCRSATINCPTNHSCIISCTGEWSCRSVKINPPIVSSLFNLLWSGIGSLADVSCNIPNISDSSW